MWLDDAENEVEKRRHDKPLRRTEDDQHGNDLNGHEIAAKLAKETGFAHHPSGEGDHVTGIYRQRIILASGRFAMIDDGLGFQLVPWRPALEQKLGQHVTGTMSPGGAVDWNFGRKRGLEI